MSKVVKLSELLDIVRHDRLSEITEDVIVVGISPVDNPNLYVERKVTKTVIADMLHICGIDSLLPVLQAVLQAEADA